MSLLLPHIDSLSLHDPSLIPPSSGFSHGTASASVQYVGLIPPSQHGQSFFINILCRDQGSPPRSATSTVILTYMTTTTSSTTPTTTTTTVTSPPAGDDDIFDDDAFVGLFSTLMVVLGVGLIAGLWYLFQQGGAGCSCFNHGASRPSPRPSPRPLTPVKSIKVRPAPVNSNFENVAWRNNDGMF